MKNKIILHETFNNFHLFHVTTDPAKTFQENKRAAENLTGAVYMGRWCDDVSIMVLNKID